MDSEVVSEKFETRMPVDRRVFNDYFNEAAVEKGGRRRSSTERLVQRDVEYLDSVSTIDEENREISVSLINKSLENDIDCAIEISDETMIKSSQMHSVWSTDIKAYNSEETEDISIESSEPAETNGKMRIRIPRHSINVLKLKY